jgi:polyferredoxin
MTTDLQSIQRTPVKIKPRLRGWRSLLTHHTFRRLSQIIFALFILYTAIIHTLVGENSGQITASAEAYCPFGGLETLYKYLTGGGSFVAHTHLSNVVLLAAVLITALLFHSAFCGWICPLGFLQDLVSSFSRWTQKRLPRLRKGITRFQATRGFVVADRYLRYLKYLVLAWAIGGSIYFGYMVFRDVDPWSALLSLFELSFTPGLIVLGISLVGAFFVERPWCRYACPLGAASGLIGKLSPTYLKREESACKVCQVCTKACPMGLPVHTSTVIRSADCNTCLECVGACPRQGALEIKFGVPYWETK